MTVFSDLRTNFLTAPLGVGKNPRFSFRLDSDGYDVVLSSYKLTLTDPSGRVVFEESKSRDSEDLLETTGIACGAELESFTRYEWKLEGVAESDAGRHEIESASAFFETGYIGKPLENAKWITLGKTYYENRGVDFRLNINFEPASNEFSFRYSENSTSGFIFGAADEGNYYLVKFATDLDSGKLTATLSESVDGRTVALREKDITSLYGAEKYKNSRHKLSIISGEKVSVSLDGKPIFEEKLNIRGGGFGFTQSFPTKVKLLSIDLESSDERIHEDFSDPKNLILAGGFINGDGYVIKSTDTVFPLDFAPTPLFRRSVKVRKGLVKARMNASAAGIYELFINGKKVGGTYFNPGRTRVQSRVMYQTYDVTEFFTEGENTLETLVGHGWYNRAMNYAGSTLAFIGELILTYNDGEERIVTDSDWLSDSDGAVRYDDIFNGEIFDARMKNSGKWVNAKETTMESLSIGKLVPQRGPQVKCFETLEPISVTEPLPGVRVYDFGKNIAGICRLKLKGVCGAKVTMRHAEVLNAENVTPRTGAPGTINDYGNRTAANHDIYILAGDGEEIFEPSLVYHGFRYMEFTTDGNVEIEEVNALVLCSEMRLTGDFDCPDVLVDKFVENTRQSMIDNFLSVPTDCPQRDERLGWAGDAQVFAATAAYLADIFGFMDKYMADTRDSQSTDGNFDDRAPNNKPRESPVGGWSDAGVIIPYLMYRQSGDKEFIKSNYAAMKRYADLIISIFSKNNYIDVDIPNTFGKNTYGDWLGVETTPCVITETAFGEHSLRLLSEMAGIIGKDSDRDYLAGMADRVKAAWNREFVLPDGSTKCDPKVYGTGYWGNSKHPDTGEVNTQCSWVIGLAFGLFDEKTAPLAAKKLADSVISGGYNIRVGFLGVGLILPVLTMNGYSDQAFRMLRQTTCPSWLYQVKNGATSIYECWDGYYEKDGKITYKGSLNHYSYGAAVEWLFSHVLGIRGEAPGFGKIILSPTVNKDLGRASGHYDSIRGTVASEWAFEDDSLVCRFEVPANTRAKIYLPKSGKWIGSKAPENPFEVTDKPIIVGSGKYEFRLVK